MIILKTLKLLYTIQQKRKIVNPKAHQVFIEEAQKLGKTCEAFLIENANMNY
jgi:hypothetical protein